LFGVPLAALLDELGFFEAAAAVVTGGRGRDMPVLSLWILAAGTTVVLNLDTTVVLLTPLYARVARRSGTDPLPLVVIPLLLASLASSVLPVSNLTNLIVVDKLHVGVGAFVTHLALPSLVASTVGWLVYRRRYPRRIERGEGHAPDRRALAIGGAVVAGVLVGFVVGPAFGIDPWVTAAGADVVLVAITRVVPWRSVPLLTAAGIAALAALVGLVVPAHALRSLLAHGVLLPSVGAAVMANAVNNLPATLVAVDSVHRMSWGMWAWLLGVNTAAVLVPVGALANLLWLRIVRAEGMRVRLSTYVRATVPIALPAFAAAVVVLGLDRVAFG
jgi:arsenical pump membrane protein